MSAPITSELPEGVPGGGVVDILAELCRVLTSSREDVAARIAGDFDAALGAGIRAEIQRVEGLLAGGVSSAELPLWPSPKLIPYASLGVGASTKTQAAVPFWTAEGLVVVRGPLESFKSNSETHTLVRVWQYEVPGASPLLKQSRKPEPVVEVSAISGAGGALKAWSDKVAKSGAQQEDSCTFRFHEDGAWKWLPCSASSLAIEAIDSGRLDDTGNGWKLGATVVRPVAWTAPQCVRCRVQGRLLAVMV
jgi:hypothetical protein